MLGRIFSLPVPLPGSPGAKTFAWLILHESARDGRNFLPDELFKDLRAGGAIQSRSHFTWAPVASASSSARSRTRTVSSSERDLTASSIIVMQNGHPTATHSGFASLN